MLTKKFFKGFTLIAFSAVFSLSTLQSAYARPGALATAPLFLSSIVEPNVFFTHDDSGSMNWEMMVSSGTGGFTASSGLPRVGSYYRYYYNPQWYTDSQVLPPATIPVGYASSMWIFRNHNGNKNYYNPDIVYSPWSGTDASGNPMYEDADETNVLLDPNNPGGSSSDLTAWHDFYDYDGCGGCRYDDAVWLPTYYEWTDTNGNGVIEPGDDSNRVEIAAGTDEMQNFANWFQYYRSREYSTKASIGRVINNTDASRMGLDVFNAGPQENAMTMSDNANKRQLLNTFYNINSSGGTPARRSMDRVGQLFMTTGANAPILDFDNGGECQQNFNILLSDGFWNGGNPGAYIGNADSNTGGGNDTEFDGNAAQSNDGGNYADSHSNTIADVAMYYYETDLSGLEDNVPTQEGIDENPKQHLVTYTIAFGLNGTLDSTDPLDDPVTGANFTGWPNAFDGNAEKVDDLWHAAYNGRGKHLSAQNPTELEESLNAAIADIAERTATAAAVSINSTQLNTDTVVYLAEFNTNRWQGDLKAFRIADFDTGELSTTPDWSAGEELDARWNSTTNSLSPDRVIMTHNGTDGVPFRWTDLTTEQKNDLKTSPSGGALEDDTQGMLRLDYLRGDRSNEGTLFRERLSLLGDLVNSGPVYVGVPSVNWPDVAPFPSDDGERYSDFKLDKAGREGIVYAAANDGMLHGFAETDGEEKLAYIPKNLFSTGASEGMHYLTEQTYNHKYYNDLTPTISDVYTDLGNGNRWQTILINGQRGGGRGIYALNVDNPNNFTEANAAKIALWEFSSDDNANLGYTFSQPQIAYTNDDRWVVIFGNGYNADGDGKGKLFILDIKGGVDGWDAADIIEIDTTVGSTGDPNGLSTPRIADLDGNGTVDRVYAGDMYGNLWAFDLSSDNAATWIAASSTKKLFTTIGAEPITTAPVLAKHPTISDESGNLPNVMVFFGTGQYLTNNDKTSTDLNHFYGVWDKGDYNLDKDSLEKQDYLPGFEDDDGNPVRVLTQKTVNYAGGEYGWYFELDESGEKSIFMPVVRAGIIFFTTFIPNPDPCSAGGDNFFFSVDMINGGSPGEPQTDTNGDGTIDEKDQVKNGTDTGVMAARKSEGLAPNPVFVDDIAYTGSTPTKVRKLKKIPTGRFSWQELLK